MAKILYYGANIKITIHLLLWFIILYYTKSSTGYLLISVCTLVFIYLYIKKTYHEKNNLIRIMIGITLSLLLIILIIPIYNLFRNVDTVNQIEYLLIDKIVNFSNRDTMSRKVPLFVNYKIFLEFPILGVGNGNQGFFYLKHFPSWAYSSYDVNLLIRNASETLSNGSLFLPSILSGYGMLGILMLGVYSLKCRKLVISEKNRLGMFYYMFIISVIIIIITGFSSEFVGNYSIWFCLSLPYLADIDSHMKEEDYVQGI